VINRKILFAILLSVIFLISSTKIVYAVVGATCDPAPCVPAGPAEVCRCHLCKLKCQGTLCIENPICADSFEELISSLIDGIFWLAIVVCPLMVIIGAFFYLTSAGNPEKIRTAKNILLYTAIGFAIIMFAKAIMAIIEGALGGGP